MTAGCVFCKIASGEIPVPFVYEDDEFVAFGDANPQAPVHLLVIPRAHYETLLDVSDTGVLGRALHASRMAASKAGIDDAGYRTVINCKENGGQTVYHLHIHVLGGRFMNWPPG